MNFLLRIPLFILIFSTAVVHAQSRKELEKKRKKMQDDIAYTKKILSKTSAKKSAALHNLNTINVILKKRSAVIDDLHEELNATETEIYKLNRQLALLKGQYDKEKEHLRKTVIKAYKSRKNANEVAFVFASGSFRQALRRLKYLKKLSEYRTYLIHRIEQSKDSVQSGLVRLEKTKEDKKVILAEQVSEKQNLEKDRKTKAGLVNVLSKEEKSLKSKIRKNETAIAKLNSSISRMIAAELAAARKKAEAVAKKSAGSKDNATADKTASKTSESKIALTPEARALSNSFASSAGALPWPLERGYISQTFGVHPHPDLAGITLINNGVDITTGEGSSARSVFGGKVSAIINIPGQEKAVLVNHGEYFTVYSRLSEVYVKRGDEISAKQKLGKVWTDDDGKTILQFQVWKGQVKQNPSNWLSSK